MKKIAIVTVLAYIMSPYSLYAARSCDKYEYDKAEYFSEKAGRKIVGEFGGGNIRVEMKSCEYNSYSELFNTTIEIYWDGAVFSSHKYEIDGELQMNSEGGSSKFTKTYANDRLKKLKFWTIVAGSALILGALASERGKSR